MDSVYQIVNINDRYYADIDLFSEEYDVYDSEKNDTVGTYWEIEKKDLFEKIIKQILTFNFEYDNMVLEINGGTKNDRKTTDCKLH